MGSSEEGPRASANKDVDSDEAFLVDTEYVNFQTTLPALDLNFKSRVESDIERQPSR